PGNLHRQGGQTGGPAASPPVRLGAAAGRDLRRPVSHGQDQQQRPVLAAPPERRLLAAHVPAPRRLVVRPASLHPGRGTGRGGLQFPDSLRPDEEPARPVVEGEMESPGYRISIPTPEFAWTGGRFGA